MNDKIIYPDIPVTSEGAIDIEAINPYGVEDIMTFEQLCEKLTVLMVRCCLNRHVAHLVQYGRTRRVREKNLVRLWMIELPKLLEVFA